MEYWNVCNWRRARKLSKFYRYNWSIETDKVYKHLCACACILPIQLKYWNTSKQCYLKQDLQNFTDTIEVLKQTNQDMCHNQQELGFYRYNWSIETDKVYKHLCACACILPIQLKYWNLDNLSAYKSLPQNFTDTIEVLKPYQTFANLVAWSDFTDTIEVLKQLEFLLYV